jgi:C-terminal domain of Sin3a protein
VLSAINQSIDANKYEDFARAVLGNKAYLLFAFDKLVIAVRSG